jgi:hypothetical protein
MKPPNYIGLLFSERYKLVNTEEKIRRNSESDRMLFKATGELYAGLYKLYTRTH